MRPNAGIITRAVTYPGVQGDFELTPKYPRPTTGKSSGLSYALFLNDVNLDAVCASNKFRFIRFVIDGAPSNRKVARPALTRLV